MTALVGAFNQEKALVGAFSVIVKTGCGTDGALHSTTHNVDNCARFHVFRDPALEDKCAHIKTYKYYFVHRRAAGATNGVTTPHYSPQPPP